MLRISGIDHIVLRTANMDSMLQFYTGLLGCTLERRTDPAVGLVQLRAGNALIDLVATDSELGRIGGDPPRSNGNNLDHYCLKLEDIAMDDLRRYLKTKGVEVGAPERRYGADGYGQSVYIADPDGNRIELKPG